MSDSTPAGQSNRGAEGAREQLVARVRQLFGEARAAAVSNEIGVAAAAVERVRRLTPPEFAGLDPEERG